MDSLRPKIPKTVRLMRRQGTTIHYSDYAYASHSFQGLTIHFANFVPSDDAKDGESIAEEATVVGMSPEQAKSLHDLLGKQLKVYEQQFGEIRTLALDQARDSS